MAEVRVQRGAVGDTWEVHRDGKAVDCQLTRHGALASAARLLRDELARPAADRRATLTGAEWVELERLAGHPYRCDGCGTTEFVVPPFRALRSVVQCLDCGCVQCYACARFVEESPGCSVRHCFRCGSQRATNPEVWPPDAEPDTAPDPAGM